MKRILSLTLILALLISITGIALSVSVFAEESARPTPVDLTTREDFGWGINTHAQHYNSYPEIYLEDRMSLVARLGSDWIRLNGSIPNDGDWSYLDYQVGIANKYGLKIIMVTEPSMEFGLDYITLWCRTIAERYNGENGRGFVDVFQVWNETDTVLLKAKYGNSAASGSDERHYYTIDVPGAEDLPEYLEYFKAARQGIDEAGGKSKFMINFCATHWGCFQYYLEQGLKIDFIGWDEYTTSPYNLEKSAVDIRQNCENFYNDVIKTYKIPVIVAETNIHMGKVKQAHRENPTSETYDALIDMLYIFYEQPWIKAAIFYELLDEPALISYDKNGVLDEENSQEAYFGLVKCENGGIIGDPKPIYYELQKLLKGNSTLPVIKRGSVDLNPYKSLVVDTADDTGIGGNANTEPVVTDDTPISLDDWDTEFDTEFDNLGLDDEPVTDNPVKYLKLKETTTEKPWGWFLIFGSIMLVIPAAYIVIYLLIKKKKLAKVI